MRTHTRVCVGWVSLCARYTSANGRDVKYFTSKIGACAYPSYAHTLVCVCVGFLHVRDIYRLTGATSNTLHQKIGACAYPFYAHTLVCVCVGFLYVRDIYRLTRVSDVKYFCQILVIGRISTYNLTSPCTAFLV